jgi:hypothetical protein
LLSAANRPESPYPMNKFRFLAVSIALSLLVAPATATPKPEAQAHMIYWGSMGATVKAPAGWRYLAVKPSIQESEHIFALYGLDNVPTREAQFYITFIPSEIRHPNPLEREVELDRETSKGQGLAFLKTDKYKTDTGLAGAVTVYKGKGFERTVGILSSENGVFMVIGTSRSKPTHAQVYNGVLETLTSSVLMKTISLREKE